MFNEPQKLDKESLDNEFRKMTDVRSSDVDNYMKKLVKKQRKLQRELLIEKRKNDFKNGIKRFFKFFKGHYESDSYGRPVYKEGWRKKLKRKVFFILNDAEELAYESRKKTYESSYEEISSPDYKDNIIEQKKFYVDASDKVDWYEKYDYDEETIKKERKQDLMFVDDEYFSRNMRKKSIL